MIKEILKNRINAISALDAEIEQITLEIRAMDAQERKGFDAHMLAVRRERLLSKKYQAT
jgi:hypothetical protein